MNKAPTFAILRRGAQAGVLALLMMAAPCLAASMSFKAADGETVYAALCKAAQKSNAVALLFHQAGANRHEYDRIAPRLNALGFDTLALDQRSGGRKFGGDNKTVNARSGSASYLDAYADLEGAVEWAQAHDYKTVVAVGSSYSASLTLRLAADHGDALAAVAVFSPGEYFDDPDLVKNAVADIAIPVYITTDPAEERNVDEVLKNAGDANITRYQPESGVHGASTLVADRDPHGYQANRQSFRRFMARFAPAS